MAYHSVSVQVKNVLDHSVQHYRTILETSGVLGLSPSRLSSLLKRYDLLAWQHYEISRGDTKKIKSEKKVRRTNRLWWGLNMDTQTVTAAEAIDWAIYLGVKPQTLYTLLQQPSCSLQIKRHIFQVVNPNTKPVWPKATEQKLIPVQGTNKGHNPPVPVLIREWKHDKVVHFASMRQAADYLGVSTSSILTACNNKTAIAGQYSVRRAVEPVVWPLLSELTAVSGYGRTHDKSKAKKMLNTLRVQHHLRPLVD